MMRSGAPPPTRDERNERRFELMAATLSVMHDDLVAIRLTLERIENVLREGATVSPGSHGTEPVQEDAV